MYKKNSLTNKKYFFHCKMCVQRTSKFAENAFLFFFQVILRIPSTYNTTLKTSNIKEGTKFFFNIYNNVDNPSHTFIIRLNHTNLSYYTYMKITK